MVGIAGEVLLIREDDQLQALDTVTGYRIWSKPPFEQQVELQLGPGAILDTRFVSPTDDRVVRLVTRTGEGSRIAWLDVKSGTVTVSNPLPYVLSSPIADEHGRLFAAGQSLNDPARQGVASFREDGAALWFFASPATGLAGTFEGRVYLKSGQVLDAATGQLLYEVAGGLKGTWITHDRMYVTRECVPIAPENDACMTIAALSTTDGSLLWAREVEADRFSNPAVGRDLSVHLVAEQIVQPDHFAGSQKVSFDTLAFDADGNAYGPDTEFDGGQHTELIQLGRLIVTRRDWAYRGYLTTEYAAILAPADLIPPAGWIPGRGSRAADFRPE